MTCSRRKLIVGLTGKAGSGKDSAARGLIEDWRFEKLSFAGILKDAVALIYGWRRELLDDQDFKAAVDPFWGLAPREALQTFGTDACRDILRNDIWVKALERKIQQTEGDVIITDVRFPNEADAIHEWGGDVVRVRRQDWDGMLKADEAQHSSETAMDDYHDIDGEISAPSGELDWLSYELKRHMYLMHDEVNAFKPLFNNRDLEVQRRQEEMADARQATDPSE